VHINRIGQHRRWTRLLTLALAAVCVCTASAAPRFDWRLPGDVAPPPVPADNPMSQAKVELGRRLFYDADLSIDGTMACATCHEQRRAFADGNATHPGVGGATGRRNVMGLANVAYLGSLTWGDPGLGRLETQVLVPVLGEHPVEMGMAGQSKALVERLSRDACYRQVFAAAFPDAPQEISMTAVTRAIAAFERTLLSFDAPYDRYRRGDRGAVSEAAKRGAALFVGPRLRCAGCHAGPSFTDADRSDGRPGDAFHDIGRPRPQQQADRGLSEITSSPEDDGRFRTPGLRNVALTAPYMHDGSVKSLAEAVRVHALPMDNGEVGDLTAFLESLTDPRFVTERQYALPETRCGKRL
jgi:cytochrome c peroxidase